MTQQQLVRVRHTPRISAPKLGEYLSVAAAHRRERILRDQKYQPTYLVARYGDAHNLIRAALLSDYDVPSRLMEKAALLAGRPSPTKFRADATDCSVQAIRRFARLYDYLGLKGITPVMAGAQSMPISIEGVSISVAPAVMLMKSTRAGDRELGALLPIYNKSIVLDAHGGEAVAEILRRSLSQAGHANVKPKLCIVVDVFSGGIFYGPSRSLRLMNEIQSACREIAVRWPSIFAA